MLAWLRPRYHVAERVKGARKLAPISQVVSETGRLPQKDES